MKKTSKKTPRPSLRVMPKLYPPSIVSYRIGETALRVLALLAQSHNPYRISKILNCHKGTINGKKGHLRSFEARGLAKKKNHVWSITKLGLKVLKEEKYTTPKLKRVANHAHLPRPFTTPNKNIRAHGFQLSLSLPRTFQEWPEVLEKSGLEYKRLRLGQHRLIINGFKIWLCKKSIVVYFPESFSYFTAKASEGKLKAVNTFFDIIKEIEDKLGYTKASFSTNGHYELNINKQHYAHIKNALAEEYNSHNKKLEVSDKEGKVWLLIDNSFKLNEMETIKAASADIDMDNVVKPFFNDLKENPESLNLSQLTKYMQELVFHNKETAAGLNAITKYMASQLPSKDKKPEEKRPEERGAYFG